MGQPPQHASKPKMVRARFDYNALEQGELSFKENDIITVLDDSSDGWHKGQLNGKTGVSGRVDLEIHR